MLLRAGADLLSTVTRRLNDIDKGLAPAFNKVFIDAGIDSAATKGSIQPEMELLVKNIEGNKNRVAPEVIASFEGLSPAEAQAFGKQKVNDVFQALYLDNDQKNLQVLMEAYGASPDLLNKVRPIFDDLYQKQKAVGREVGYLENYLPSGVKDYRTYLKRTGS